MKEYAKAVAVPAAVAAAVVVAAAAVKEVRSTPIVYKNNEPFVDQFV